MIINKSNATMIYEKINATREVSKLSFDEDKFVRYCHTLNKIASLNPKIKMLGDYQIGDYKVLPSMSDLVIPRKISFEVGQEHKDYRSDSYKEYVPMNYGFDECINVLEADEFNAVTKGIAGSRKKSMEGTSIDTFSKEVTISSVITRFANLDKGLSESFVAPQTDYFVPINSTIVSYTEDFQTQKAEVCFKMWLQNALSKIGSDN